MTKSRTGSKKNRGKPRFLISDLCVHLESYLSPKQIQEVYRAYLFSAEPMRARSAKVVSPTYFTLWRWPGFLQICASTISV